MLSAGATGGRCGRGGFTLVEVMVALAIVVALSAVLVPQALQRLAQGNAAALATDLKAINGAVHGFRGDVGRYPGRLSYLSAAPPAGAVDGCSQPIPDVSTWNGPYLAQTVPAAGLPVGPSLIANQTGRSPSVPTAAQRVGVLLVRVTGVERSVADQLERTMDGDADLAAGNIRWSAGGTLEYAIPIRGC